MLKCKWLSIVTNILNHAFNVAAVLTEGKGHVLIYCQSGVGGTPVLSSLSQVICDPYYRTFDGLAALVHKEWCYYKYDFQKKG